MNIIINSVIATPICPICGRIGTVALTTEQAARYNEGGPIHEALPEVPRAEREQLISGTHPDCWTQAFG